MRKSRGISQLKLAMDLNMNQNSISRYENGEREADYAALIRFRRLPSRADGQPENEQMKARGENP